MSPAARHELLNAQRSLASAIYVVTADPERFTPEQIRGAETVGREAAKTIERMLTPEVG